jgi:hypothetical protein
MLPLPVGFKVFCSSSTPKFEHLLGHIRVTLKLEVEFPNKHQLHPASLPSITIKKTNVNHPCHRNLKNLHKYEMV